MDNDKKKLYSDLLSTDSVVKRKAIISLKKFADIETIEQIEKFYNDQDASIRYFAKKIVREIKDKLSTNTDIKNDKHNQIPKVGNFENSLNNDLQRNTNTLESELKNENLKYCPKCNKENINSRKSCSKCNYKFQDIEESRLQSKVKSINCPECGILLSSSFKNCPHCDTEIVFNPNNYVYISKKNEADSVVIPDKDIQNVAAIPDKNPPNEINTNETINGTVFDFIISTIFGLYFYATLIIFIPYYNINAITGPRLKPIAHVKATIKAFGWPYFVYNYFSSVESKTQSTQNDDYDVQSIYKSQIKNEIIKNLEFPDSYECIEWSELDSLTKQKASDLNSVLWHTPKQNGLNNSEIIGYVVGHKYKCKIHDNLIEKSTMFWLNLKGEIVNTLLISEK